MNRRRGVFWGVLVVLVGAVVALIIWGGWRLRDWKRERAADKAVEAQGYLAPLTEATLLRPDPHVGYGLRPNTEGGEYIRGHIVARCSIGPDGFRVVPGAPCESGAAPVVFMGGSYTFGQFVEDGEAYPAVYAAKAGDRCVVNAGVPGYGTAHVLAQLAQMILRMEPAPRLVCCGFMDDHLRRVGLDPQWFRSLLGIPLSTSVPLYRLGPGGLVFERIADRDHPPRALTPEFRLREREWELTVAMLERCLELTAARSIPFVVLYLGEIRRVAFRSDEGSLQNVWLAALLDQRGIPLINLGAATARMAEERGISGDALIGPDNAHPSAAWHRLAGEHLARVLPEFLSSSGAAGGV